MSQSIPMAHRISNAVELANFNYMNAVAQRAENERKVRHQQYTTVLPSILLTLDKEINYHLETLKKDVLQPPVSIENIVFNITLPLGIGTPEFQEFLNNRLAEYDYQMYISTLQPEYNRKGDITLGIAAIRIKLPINHMPPG